MSLDGFGPHDEVSCGRPSLDSINMTRNYELRKAQLSRIQSFLSNLGNSDLGHNISIQLSGLGEFEAKLCKVDLIGTNFVGEVLGPSLEYNPNKKYPSYALNISRRRNKNVSA